MLKSMGRTNKRILLVYVLIFGFITIYLVGDYTGLWALVDGGGETITTDPSTEYDIVAPTLGIISPNPSTTGNIRLDWDDAEVANPDLPSDLDCVHYRVYKRKDSGIWKSFLVFHNEFYYDYNLADGIYEYKIQSAFYKPMEIHYSEYSAVQSVVVELVPTNPSIIINSDGSPDGANATNSLEVILTLSCNDADEMSFQISEDIWTNWTAYETTYTITLSENDPWAPNYRVGVIFRNGAGETEMVYDDIIYDADAVPPPPPPPNGDEVDYTMVYIIAGAIIGIIGIFAFIKYKKRIIKS